MTVFKRLRPADQRAGFCGEDNGYKQKGGKDCDAGTHTGKISRRGAIGTSGVADNSVVATILADQMLDFGA